MILKGTIAALCRTIYTKLDTTAGVLHKEWVGLTDADKEVLLANLYESVEGLITAIEAKLKDKNGW